ncbi:glycoside hydrolase family 43 protein [Microbacterium karelineae]|uniref:glycoside hydrolase family 43 protein n=1 Tax=Microbacterium karelineae TaxID=2654283 RepID=UPI0012EAC49D|nr:glycoside hydrolase 43 family protein [Microbacterium karelineae]
MNLTGEHHYRNPIIDADLPDPDAIRVGDRYVMTASSFNRAPGLPVYVSDDLVNWERVGDALPAVEPRPWFDVPRHGGGVWAPSIRHHGGVYFIVYPDPDQGIFVVTATDPAGPWSAPHLLLGGLGLIDPCPLWDDDGRAYLVHGWARSRAGRKNVLSVAEVDPELREVLSPARDVIDGALLDGWMTLEGPKFYARDGWYWILAPAGGVATGWQAAFRSREPYGPYEERIVLAQGSTPVNGPHQGAWVSSPDGRDWFLHFQDRGPFGRVVHLQPMSWGEDGWPLMGAAVDGGPDEPVLTYPSPHGTAQGRRTLARDDDFAAGVPGPYWTWQANPDPEAIVPGSGALRLRSSEDAGNVRVLPRVLGQPLPGMASRSRVGVALEGPVGSRAGLAILGRDYVWAGIRRTASGDEAVVAARGRDDLAEHVIARWPVAGEAEVELACGADAAITATITAGGSSVDVDPGVMAAEGQWIGAEVALFAGSGYGAPDAVGTFTHFRIDLDED